jgi:hypothetical protein
MLRERRLAERVIEMNGMKAQEIVISARQLSAREQHRSGRFGGESAGASAACGRKGR